jgi:hypothetical protein
VKRVAWSVLGPKSVVERPDENRLEPRGMRQLQEREIGHETVVAGDGGD